MNFFKSVIDDLRERKLLPVAIVLLAGIIAVPVALSKSAKPSPATPIAAAVPAGPVANGIPAVQLSTSVPHSNLNGRARNPFQTPAGSTSTSSALANAVKSASSGGSSSGGSSNGSSSGGSSKSSTSSGSSSGKSSSTTSSTGGAAPVSTSTPSPSAPAPITLAPDQVFDVAYAATNDSGGVNTTDPLTRLSPLPNKNQPLMVELGVLKGGKRVLFALLPGAVVSGPGKCIPGPIDCEVLSLAPGQIETLSDGSGLQSTEFAVTAVRVATYGSTAAATNARKHVSNAGQQLLASAHLHAVSLFPYDVGTGSLIDIRNLKVS